jgi:hypothetical protein
MDRKLLNLSSKKKNQFWPIMVRPKPKPNISKNIILGVLSVRV